MSKKLAPAKRAPKKVKTRADAVRPTAKAKGKPKARAAGRAAAVAKKSKSAPARPARKATSVAKVRTKRTGGGTATKTGSSSVSSRLSQGATALGSLLSLGRWTGRTVG